MTNSDKDSSSSSGFGNGEGDDDDDDLDTKELVGIIVGILGFIATAVGAWFSYKALKVNKSHPPLPWQRQQIPPI